MYGTFYDDANLIWIECDIVILNKIVVFND